MYSILWEIETGAVYRMTKANDIYSGLGQYDQKLEAQADKDDDEDEPAVEKKDLLDTIIEETEEAGVEAEPEKDAISKDLSASQLLLPPTVPESKALSPPAVSTKAQILAPLELRKKQEAALVRAIQRAENIVTSFEGIKVSIGQKTRPHLIC